MKSQDKLSPFARSLCLTAGLFAILTLAFAVYTWSEKQIDHAHEKRQQSFMLADELRQSSDGLTRMARAYVVTGEPHYKKYFQDILNIRDGKKARPKDYHRIYWDFMLPDDKTPRSDSQQAIPLIDLMRQAGFSDEEFQKLAEAKEKSDELALTEFEAMKLAETNGPENHARALMMVYDAHYRQAKAAIMKPIDEFFDLMDQRTLKAIHLTETYALIFRNLFVLFGLALTAALWRTYQILRATLGGSVDEVQAEIIKIGSGNFSSPIQVPKDMENSVIGWLSVTQAQLLELNDERKAAQAKLHRQVQLYDALSHCNQALVRSTEPTELFAKVCRNIVHFGGMKMAWIGLADIQKQSVIPAASFGTGVKYLEKIKVSLDPKSPLSHGPTGTALRESRPFWCQDFMNDPATAPWHEPAKSFGWMASASLPLFKNGIAIGALTLYTDQPHAFDEATQNLLLEMAMDISFALDNFSREAARKQAESALKESLARTQLLLDSSLDAVITIDHHNKVTGWSPQAGRLFGYSAEKAMGRELSELIIPAKLREAHNQGIARFLETGASTLIGKRTETLGMHADGTQFPIELTIAALKQQNYFFSAYIRDISQRKQIEKELQIAATAFESQEAMMITDENKIILKVNQAFTHITGYSAQEVIGKTPSILKSYRHDAKFYKTMWDTLNKEKHWQGEIWNRRKNNEIFPEWLNISAVTDASGKVINYVAACSDLSRHKKAEETIHNLAFYDPLTQLPNRRLLLERLHHALESSVGHQDYKAILFIDLDKFKELNDTSGHHIGDFLLIEVAKRLKNCMQEGDTVAHLGSDDFIIMLENLSENTQQAAAQAETVSEKILQALEQPFKLQERDYFTSASIGVSLFRNHEINVNDLLKHTETAMYQAKQSGRNAIRFFDPHLHMAMESRFALEADLRRTLSENQFRLYYQMQVNQNGHVQGAEALIRWQHPQRGLVSPTQFIPLAEESGLILPIGQWVLETACQQLKTWEANPLAQALQLAVNVSARQFRQPNFVEQVLNTLEKHQIKPRHLKLELTESMVLDDVNDTLFKMCALKKVGVRFSLDDFGTGYSSLTYLTKLPFDQIKIDQSFVRNMTASHTDAVIVQTIIGMAKNLNMEVIAEGVETETQKTFLEQQGCTLFQGFLFSKPMPIDEFELLLNKT